MARSINFASNELIAANVHHGKLDRRERVPCSGRNRLWLAILNGDLIEGAITAILLECGTPGLTNNWPTSLEQFCSQEGALLDLGDGWW